MLRWLRGWIDTETEEWHRRARVATGIDPRRFVAGGYVKRSASGVVEHIELCVGCQAAWLAVRQGSARESCRQCGSVWIPSSAVRQ